MRDTSIKITQPDTRKVVIIREECDSDKCNKLTILQLNLRINEYGDLCFVESWLNSIILSFKVFNINYAVFHRYRSERKHGGVLIVGASNVLGAVSHPSWRMFGSAFQVH